MTPARTFAGPPLPRMDDAGLTCVGIRLDGDATAWIAAATPFTTDSERAHARRFVHAVDAARHLVGRALVRRMLAVDGDFPRTRWGKPVCPPDTEASGRDGDAGRNAVDFSISHAGAMVWAAFCRAGRVGIDVEETRPLRGRGNRSGQASPDNRPGLVDAAEMPGTTGTMGTMGTMGIDIIENMAAQLHPHERDAIRALPASQRRAAFYRCWSRKEAVLKALGRGLSLPLDGFMVRTDAVGADWLVSLPGVAMQEEDHACPASVDAWTTRDIDVGPEHQCSVAASAPRLPMAVHLVGMDMA